MKILSALLAAQVLLTLFVIVKLVELDSRIVSYEGAVDRLPAAAADRVESGMDHVPTVSSGLSEASLREIFASELSTQIDGLIVTLSAGFQGGLPVNDKATGMPPEQIQAQQDKVRQLIEYHTSVGQISMADMNALQLEIGKLDEAGRKQMLRELVQRMNDGQLEGQL